MNKKSNLFKIFLFYLIINYLNFYSYTKEYNNYNFFPRTISNRDNKDSFIIRWGFQNICKFWFDPYQEIDFGTKKGEVSFNPKLVKNGDIIFVRYVPYFFNYIYPKIKSKFFIITHGDYRDQFKLEYVKYLDKRKVLGWFGIHSNILKHPKFYHLPLGIIQKREFYQNNKELNQLFISLRDQNLKTKLLYINFDKNNSSDRLDLVKILDQVNFATRAQKKPFEEYIKELAEHKFVLSPRGWGEDTYRTWETLMVGSIPIVKSSTLDPLYEDLPVLKVKNWSEITEEYLNKKYQEIMSKQYNFKKLYMQYWYDYINDIRKKISDNLKT